jgi:hypothetical protein
MPVCLRFVTGDRIRLISFRTIHTGFSLACKSMYLGTRPLRVALDLSSSRTTWTSHSSEHGDRRPADPGRRRRSQPLGWPCRPLRGTAGYAQGRSPRASSMAAGGPALRRRVFQRAHDRGAGRQLSREFRQKRPERALVLAANESIAERRLRDASLERTLDPWLWVS